MPFALILIIISYLTGSISTGYLLVKKIKGEDIRKIGSGNIGATNVSRVMGFKFALLVLFLDALKGYVVALAALYLGAETWLVLLCGLAVICGHNWPLFYGFKGGRGAATTLGFFLGFAFLPTLLVFALVVAVVLWTRYVSLGSIVGSIAIPVYMLFMAEYRSYFVFGLLVTILIIFRHIPNIKRLLEGSEPKFTMGKKTAVK